MVKIKSHVILEDLQAVRGSRHKSELPPYINLIALRVDGLNKGHVRLLGRMNEPIIDLPARALSGSWCPIHENLKKYERVFLIIDVEEDSVISAYYIKGD